MNGVAQALSNESITSMGIVDKPPGLCHFCWMEYQAKEGPLILNIEHPPWLSSVLIAGDTVCDLLMIGMVGLS